MGALISVIQDVYVPLQGLIKIISTLNAQYQTLVDRTNNPPSAPAKNPTRPHWFNNPPFPNLVDIQGDLPAEADVVIIGSGITGAAAARALIALSPKPLSIVVLESRQLCSGATGRNGGHIKPTPHDMFASLKRSIGEERSAEVTKFMMRHMEVLKDVGEEVKEGQVREVETVDLFISEKDFEDAKSKIIEAKKWLPGFECDIWGREEAKLKFGASDAVVGATTYKAGALWPYRLVTSVWNDLLKTQPENLIISTHTTVEAVTANNNSTPYMHTVKTTRGSLNAKHVLHATNAYAPYLVRSLIGCLAGFRAQMTAQRPGANFPVQNPERSWSIIHEPDYEYITQLLPEKEVGEEKGLLMVGGAFMRSQDQGPDAWGVWDDGTEEAMTSMVLRGCMSTVFDGWGGDGGVVSSWSGIVGMTGDLLPFVGRLGKEQRRKNSSETVEPGQWISAGYSGEGMVMAWLSATAVAIMMLGLDNEDLKGGKGIPEGKLDSWFPREEFGMSSARMRRAKLQNLLNEVT